MFVFLFSLKDCYSGLQETDFEPSLLVLYGAFCSNRTDTAGSSEPATSIQRARLLGDELLRLLLAPPHLTDHSGRHSCPHYGSNVGLQCIIKSRIVNLGGTRCIVLEQGQHNVEQYGMRDESEPPETLKPCVLFRECEVF
jgi:hypothetical protein